MFHDEDGRCAECGARACEACNAARDAGKCLSQGTHHEVGVFANADAEMGARLAAAAPNPSGTPADWKLWLNALSAVIERKDAQIARLRSAMQPLVPHHHGSCVTNGVITPESCVCDSREKEARAALAATESKR